MAFNVINPTTGEVANVCEAMDTHTVGEPIHASDPYLILEDADNT